MATSAEKVPGGWVINGAKNWITNGPHADYILLFAVTDRSGPKVKHTAFVIPKGTPGFTQNPRDHKLGIHAAHSCTVFFEGCKVPDEAVVGSVGEGFKVAMATLDIFRSTVGAAALGFARRALHETVEYAATRKLFGAPLGDLQMTQATIADSATEVDAAALLVYRAAWVKDQGAERVTREAAMAKMFATEAAQRVIDRAVQLHGGAGVRKGVKVEELYREIRALRIYEGATEVQKIVIAREMLKQRPGKAALAAE
jgi:alkylation response protein AidB-like acyl-CoA dehydrogenase